MGEYYFKFKIRGKTEDGDNVYANLEGKIEGGAVDVKMKDETVNIGIAGKVISDSLKVDMKGLEKIALKGIEPKLLSQPPAPSAKKRYERRHPPLSLRDKGRVYEYLKKGYTNEQIKKKMPHVDEWHIRGCKAYLTRQAQARRKK